MRGCRKLVYHQCSIMLLRQHRRLRSLLYLSSLAHIHHIKTHIFHLYHPLFVKMFSLYFDVPPTCTRSLSRMRSKSVFWAYFENNACLNKKFRHKRRVQLLLKSAFIFHSQTIHKPHFVLKTKRNQRLYAEKGQIVIRTHIHGLKKKNISLI